MRISARTKNIILSIVVPLLLLVAVVAICIWGFSQRSKAESYRSATVSMYRRTYSDLLTKMNTLEVTLSKLAIAGSRTQYIMLLDDVWQTSGACVSLMSQIPASHVDSSELNSFLVRIEDYARTLSQSILKGNAVTDTDTKQINSLRASCNELEASLTERYNSGSLPTEILNHDGYFVSAGDEYSSESKKDYPVLIYDGPFSESAEKKEPKGVVGLDISKERAYEVAVAHLEEGSTLSFSSESAGDIPAYDFSGNTQDGRAFDISISKTGGFLIWYMCEATSNISGIPNDIGKKDLTNAGKKFLSDHNYDNMEATYAQYYGGTALINFVSVQDDALCYNDLIKVWIDRQTQKIVGVDARNYLFSHKERELAKVTVTSDEAKNMLSSKLEIKQVELALIPLSPEIEALCHEFTCRFDGEDYIVYVNVETGEEEQIFKIIQDEFGTLTL